MKLTKKQTVVLDFIDEFTRERGFSPSYREIMNGVGLRSVSAVAEHVDNLVEKGALIKAPGEARSLTVVDFRHPETVQLFQQRISKASKDEIEILRQAAEILELDLETE